MRIPLANNLQSRDGTLAKDARLTNCFVEVKGDQSAVMKRPGLSQKFDLTSGNGNGMVCWNGTFYAAKGSSLAQGPTVSPVADGSAWSQVDADTGLPTLGGTQPFRYYSSTYFDSKAWIVNGRASGATENADVYSSIDGTNFTLATSSPGWSNRILSAVTTFGSNIWVCGGQSGGFDKNDVWYSANGTSWTLATAGAGWSARSSHGFVSDGTKLWVIGSNADAQVWYSANGATWTQSTSNGGWTPIDLRQRCVYFNGKLWVIGDTVYSSTDGVTWNQTTASPGWASGSTGVALTYGGRLWFIRGNTTGQVYTSIDGVTWTLKSSGVGFASGTLQSAVVFGDYVNAYSYHASNYSGEAYQAVINSPGGYTYTIADLGTQFTSTAGNAGTPYLFVKNSSNAWVLTAGSPGTLTLVSDADYPATTVPGCVYLDGYIFVMDSYGVIYNSDLENPTSWNSLNYLTAESEPDTGVGIAKHQNYIVALKTITTELFYDAANASGSPLASLSNTPIRIGCGDGNTIATVDGNLFFMSQTNSQGKSVHMFAVDGLSPVEIATEDVKRILAASTLTTVRAFAMRMSGHSFYVLNLLSDGVSLAYDLTTKLWATWTYREAAAAITLTSLTQVDGVATAIKVGHGFSEGDAITHAGATPSGYNVTANITYVDADTYTFPVSSALSSPATGTITATGTTETHFPFSAFQSCGGVDYIQHEDSGVIYEISPDYTDDNGQYIDVHIRTSKLDNDTGEPKTIGILEVIGDKVDADVLIRYSDDDYVTWSKYRPVDLNIERSRLRRLGRFSRRVFELRFTDDAKLRLAALEI